MRDKRMQDYGQIIEWGDSDNLYNNQDETSINESYQYVYEFGPNTMRRLIGSL